MASTVFAAAAGAGAGVGVLLTAVAAGAGAGAGAGDGVVLDRRRFPLPFGFVAGDTPADVFSPSTGGLVSRVHDQLLSRSLLRKVLELPR